MDCYVQSHLKKLHLNIDSASSKLSHDVTPPDNEMTAHVFLFHYHFLEVSYEIYSLLPQGEKKQEQFYKTSILELACINTHKQYLICISNLIILLNT